VIKHAFLPISLTDPTHSIDVRQGSDALRVVAVRWVLRPQLTASSSGSATNPAGCCWRQATVASWIL
jgi:hypothetical protein